MPLETYLALFAFIAVFATFGSVLAWGHWYTRASRPRFPAQPRA